MGAADVVPNCPALYTRKASDPTNTLASAANEAARGLTHRPRIGTRQPPEAGSRSVAPPCTPGRARRCAKTSPPIAAEAADTWPARTPHTTSYSTGRTSGARMGGKEDVEVRVVRLQRQLHQQKRQMNGNDRHQYEADWYRPLRRHKRLGVLHHKPRRKSERKTTPGLLFPVLRRAELPPTRTSQKSHPFFGRK